MPEKITELKSGKYRVSTPGGVKSKGTTLRKALSQSRLLRAIEHGWKPTGAPVNKRYAKAVEKAKKMRLHY